MQKFILNFLSQEDLFFISSFIHQKVGLICRVLSELLLSFLKTCHIFLPVCSCHVTYAFQSETTLYSCLNVKKLLARSRREICSLSDCNWTRTQNHLVRKRTLNHLVECSFTNQVVLCSSPVAVTYFCLLFVLCWNDRDQTTGAAFGYMQSSQ